MNDILEYKKVINVPYSIIIASFIIIIVTTNMTDYNGLSALIGGYSGLMLGMLFVIILNSMYSNVGYLDMFPSLIVLTIAGLILFYLITYFDKISKGEVSSYYSSFSILSTVFLITQVIMIFSAVPQGQNTRLFTNTTFSLLGLIGIINILIVITMGIILKFYSTQG
jgi:hypothetical protein